MLRSAVIGLGDIGPVHVKAIKGLPGAQLAAVCDIDQALRPQDTKLPFFTDYREMLEAIHPDCVHICLPHYLHYPAALDAARAGCHVLTEKPLAMNIEEAKKFTELESTFQVKVGVCFQNRLNPTIQVLRKELQAPASGAVTAIYGSVAWTRSKAYYEAKPWRGKWATAGGGCMMNQAIHTLDLMQHLVPGKILSIRGVIGHLLDYGLEVEDTASAKIVFQNGIQGFFTATVANYENQSVRIKVRCENASFLLDDEKLWKLPSHGGQPMLLAENSKPSIGKAYYGNSHSALIQQFYQAVSSDSQDYVHTDDAAISIFMIDAIRRSSETGETIYL